jgi:hypothetical protein
LQRWILGRALDGRQERKTRARKIEQAQAFSAKLMGSSKPARVKRRQVPHLTSNEIVKDYFGYRPRAPSSESRSPFWWRKVSLAALNNPAFGRAKVGDLSPATLATVLKQWGPQVKTAWDRVPWQTRQTYEALLAAQTDRERRKLYAYANATLCRALRRLRARGYLEEAPDNSSIRLTPKGARLARRLLARATL